MRPSTRGSADQACRQNEQMTTAWSFLTLEEDERQFMGNAGYEDVLGRYYTWDKAVPNRERVKKGDLAVIRDGGRDGGYVLGVGWIDEIFKGHRDKERFRCVHCGSTGFKSRKTKEFKYKCSACGNEFNDPVVDSLKGIDFYRADYARTWQPLDAKLPVADIEPAYLKDAKQHAIREMDLHQVRMIISNAQPLGAPWWASGSDGGTELPGGHSVVIGKARIGQQRFREEMLSRFDNSCAICGPLPGAMLDAAHVYRYAAQPQHHLDGGLLLRRDLHALFDGFHLLIDPDDGWRVRLRPSLTKYPEIWRYDGVELQVKPDVRPKPEYLLKHAAAARETWQTTQGSV